MSKSASLFAVLLVLASCSSMQSDSGKGNSKVNIPRPELAIEQVNAVPIVAAHVQGAIPVQYALHVLNKAAKPITLKQVSVVSLGVGAYTVEQTSRPFKTIILPDQTQVVGFWVPAVASESIVGVNGPVSLRIVTYFDSPDGQFQHVVVQQVNSGSGVDGSRQ